MHRYFKVRGDDGGVYILRHDVPKDEWEMAFFDSGAREETRLYVKFICQDVRVETPPGIFDLIYAAIWYSPASTITCKDEYCRV